MNKHCAKAFSPCPDHSDPAHASLQQPCMVPLAIDLLEKVAPIEQACYSHPWTYGNFMDALNAGYHAMALLTHAKGDIMGYYVAMKGVEEAHLLNLTVAPAYQQQGCARMLLETLRLWTVSQQLTWLWLEVRQGNTRALHVYRQFGFKEVGRRKNYYPTPDGGHEHAVLMSLRVC